MADEILAAGNFAFRDYQADGVPASGLNRPAKQDVRSAFATINSQFKTLNGVNFGLVYGTLSALNANLAPTANTGATVQGDGANDGLYTKVGGTGTGSWSRISTFSLASVEADLNTAVAGFADAKRRQYLNLFDQRVRVATVGDSIYQGSHGAAADGSFITTKCRPINWTHAQFPMFDHDVWYDPANTIRYYSGLDNCYSGSWVSGGPPATGYVPVAIGALERIGDVLPMAPDIVFEESGINSISNGVSAATVITQKTAIINAIFAAGVQRIIMRTITPADDSAFTSPTAQRVALNDVNTWIRSYAAAHAPQIVLFDAFAIYDDPGNPGHPRAGYTADGLHPSSLGSQYESFALITILQKMIRPVPYRRADPSFNKLPQIAGASGTMSAGFTGQVVSGWRVANVTGGALTTGAVSVGATANGDAFQSIAFTTHSGASSEIFGFAPTSTVDLSSLANKWVRARCKVVLSPSAIWRGLQVLGGAVGCMTPIGTDTLVPTSGYALDLESPPHKLGASPGSLSAALWITLDGSTSGVTGTISIYDFEYYEVDNAKTMHNILG